MSSLLLLPGAEATTKSLPSWDLMIDATFLNWAASASELPPNFNAIVLMFAPKFILIRKYTV